MKKIIYIVTFFISAVFAVTQGQLPNLSFATYAINTYQNNWQSPLNWSVKIADSVRSAFSINIPGSTSLSLSHFENSSVATGNISLDYNFIFFHGHGAPNKFALWNSQRFMSNRSPGDGDLNTYWAWISACTVFRNDYSDQDPWFDGAFAGTHSILGYSSIGYGNSYVLRAYKKFAIRWLSENEKIWVAYYTSIMDILHTEGGYDTEPKIVYRYGNINGSFFDPWEERFSSVYMGPIFYNNDYTGYGSRWLTLGSPTY